MQTHSRKLLPLHFVIVSMLFFSGCIIVDTTPGPRGRDGFAFFGIDYEVDPPYSYWDNNPSIPYNPDLGYYYETDPGLYEFEYFINPYEYWYGTYEIWINPGMPGGNYGEPGADGMDTYFMLICDPDGYHMHFSESYKTNSVANDTIPLIIEDTDGQMNYRITIQKENIEGRPAQSPKFISTKS